MLGIAGTQVAVEDSDDVSKARLRQIIEEQSLLSGKEFTLSSGKASTIFFDLKRTMLNPEGANLLAEEVLRILEQEDVHNVGGLEMGAVPLVSQLCMKSHGRYLLNTFFVRKQPKKHGAKELVDGHLEDGSEAIVLDDVVTTGGSVLQAVEAARSRGCHVSKVIAIVDRLEGARENLEAHGLELISLFDRNDFEV